MSSVTKPHVSAVFVRENFLKNLAFGLSNSTMKDYVHHPQFVHKSNHKLGIKGSVLLENQKDGKQEKEVLLKSSFKTPSLKLNNSRF